MVIIRWHSWALYKRRIDLSHLRSRSKMPQPATTYFKELLRISNQDRGHEPLDPIIKEQEPQESLLFWR